MNSDLAAGLYNYIHNNKHYQEYCNNIKTNIDVGEGFYIETYFKYKMLYHPKESRLYDKCLNAPIQATSSDIMKLFTIQACSSLQSCISGLNNPIIPLLNRHDENIFMIHKDLIPYIGNLLNCMTIQIDDWLPLELEWSAGYYYTEPDEVLLKEIEKYSLKNNAKEFALQKRKHYTGVPVTKTLVSSDIYLNGYHFYLTVDYNTRSALGLISKQPLCFDDYAEHLKKQFLEFEMFNRIVLYVETRDKQNYYFDNSGKEFIATYSGKEYLASNLKMILNCLAREYLISVGVDEDYINIEGDINNNPPIFEVQWKILN